MPSPRVLRWSPVRENKVERHRRGRSVESALRDRDRDKDDKLALFQDMQTKEKDNFLQHSGDDSDESISVKLRDFSDFRLSISTSANRESTDLLINDTDKNDYDWLLTPPDTPLFPSLDDETPPVNLSQRGRPQSQPIRISRASRTETSSRAGRSSSSPRRSSPTSGSSSINAYSKRRASPGPSASVSPTLRSLTSSVRPLTPTSKPSTPSIRSTTPTLRRSTTGSGITVGRGGSSSGKANRGSSSSPKLQSWHSNNPEFAAEAPPNLRTSIGDRSISSTRGSSPASRRGLSPASRRGLSPASGHGVETGIASRRQSVSPTISRSASSSNSHDRDRLSSQSKGSVLSSCEDEIDSVQSTFSGKKRTSTVGMVGRQVTRKQEPYPHSRIQSFSKKSTRSTATINISSSSAPKRSFDSAWRQMDVHRNSQNMFRPLLSSAPVTSFYASKATSTQRRTYSMNSSVTTSSNASSEQGASVVPDTEGSDHDQDDVGSEREKTLSSRVQGDVVVVDKMEVENEDSKIHSTGIGRQQHDDPEHDGAESISGTTDIHLDAQPNGSDSRGKEFVLNGNDDFSGGSFVDIQEDVPGLNPMHNKDNDGTWRYLQAAQLCDLDIDCVQKVNSTSRQETFIPKCGEKHAIQIGSFLLKQPLEIDRRCMQDSNLIESGAEIGIQIATDKLTEAKQQDNVSKLKGHGGIAQYELRDDPQGIASILSQDTLGKVSLEGKGELLYGPTASMNRLGRANSCKWPVIHAKAVINLPEESSRLRRSLNDLKSIRYEDNASTSQSSDACLMKQTETRVSRQTSSRRLDTDNFAIKSNFKVPSGLSTSAIQGQNDTFQAPVHSANGRLKIGDSFIDVFGSVRTVQSGALELTAYAVAEEPGSRHRSGTSESPTGNKFIESVSTMQDDSLVTEVDAKLDTLALELMTKEQCCASNIVSNLETQDQRYACSENCDLSENRFSCSEQVGEDGFVEKKQTVAQPPEPDRENSDNDSYLLSVTDDCHAHSSLESVCLDYENTTQERRLSDLPENDKSCDTEATVSPVDQNTSDMSTEPCAPSMSEENNQSQDISSKHPESDSCNAEPINVSQEERTIKVDTPRGLSRSLTLEEATDTILFCSSIVHSLAYKAATLAMEKENLSSVEVPQPMVTIVGKPDADHRKSCAGAAARRTSKFQKIKSKQMAAHLQAPSNNIETNLKNHEPVMHVVSIPESTDTVKPLTTNSKCNCTIM